MARFFLLSPDFYLELDAWICYSRVKIKIRYEAIMDKNYEAVQQIIDALVLERITKEDALDMIRHCLELSFNMGKLHGLEEQDARDKDADAV